MRSIPTKRYEISVRKLHDLGKWAPNFNLKKNQLRPPGNAAVSWVRLSPGAKKNTGRGTRKHRLCISTLHPPLYRTAYTKMPSSCATCFFPFACLPSFCQVSCMWRCSFFFRGFRAAAAYCFSFCVLRVLYRFLRLLFVCAAAPLS